MKRLSAVPQSLPFHHARGAVSYGHNDNFFAHPSKLIPLIALHHVVREHLLQYLKVNRPLLYLLFRCAAFLVQHFRNAVRKEITPQCDLYSAPSCPAIPCVIYLFSLSTFIVSFPKWQIGYSKNSFCAMGASSSKHASASLSASISKYAPHLVAG